MEDLPLGARIAETQRLLQDLDTYRIETRLKTLMRKALKTSLLADVQALTKEPQDPYANRQPH